MKDMLTKNDLKQIGDLLDTKLDEKLGDVLEAVNTGFSDMQTDIDGLKKDVTTMKAVMVTKDYLDQKLGTVNGKITILTDVLHRNGTISDDQRKAVHA